MEASGSPEKKSNIVPRLVATVVVAVAIGGLITQNHRRNARVASEPVPCLVDGYEKFLPSATVDSSEISDRTDKVAQLNFFTTSEEYRQLIQPIVYGYEGAPLTNEQREARFKDFLEDKGIEAQAAPGVTLDDPLNASAGPYEQAFKQLAFLPKDVVVASGLKKVVFIEAYNGSEPIIPEHHAGVLKLPALTEINEGLANMILDNHCTPAERFRIFKGLYDVTRNSGFKYDPDYRYKSDDYGKYLDNGQRVFADNSDMRSPRFEFAHLFSDAMIGDNWYSAEDTDSALGKKRQIVQAVFNDLIGIIIRDENDRPVLDKSGRPRYTFDGSSLQKMRAVTSSIGSRGPHPHDQALQLKRYDERYRSATTEEGRAAAFYSYIDIQLQNIRGPERPPIARFDTLPALPRAVLTGQPASPQELKRIGEFGFSLASEQ